MPNNLWNLKLASLGLILPSDKVQDKSPPVECGIASSFLLPSDHKAHSSHYEETDGCHPSHRWNCYLFQLSSNRHDLLPPRCLWWTPPTWLQTPSPSGPSSSSPKFQSVYLLATANMSVNSSVMRVTYKVIQFSLFRKRNSLFHSLRESHLHLEYSGVWKIMCSP